MASDSGFDRGQENSLPATPLSSIRNRFQRLREGFASPRTNVTPPVTSPTSVRSFSETPALTSRNEPPPLNGSVAPAAFVEPTLSAEQQIVPHTVTPITLYSPSVTQELLSDEFLLQQQATQQVTQALDEARDIEIERSRLFQEDREARDRQRRQSERDQYQLYLRFVASQEASARSVSNTSSDTWQDVIPPTPSMEGNRNTSVMNAPPPPSLPTIGNNSISGSIQRQVATMERTMTTQMDELTDNMSQVTDPIESFDASTPSSPMPTGWKTGLSRSYRNKLHSLPFDQYDNLCDKIDEMSKSFTTTGDKVTMAMFIIDRRTRHSSVHRFLHQLGRPILE